jgi:hypothetical protein
MLLQELLQLNEKLEFKTVAAMVYDLVGDAMVTDADTKAYYKDYVDGTDEFWVDRFDEVYMELKAFYKLTQNKNAKPVELRDAGEDLANSILESAHDVKESVLEYFGNSWNFAPGHKKPRIQINLDKLDWKDTKKYIIKHFPEFKNITWTWPFK